MKGTVYEEPLIGTLVDRAIPGEVSDSRVVCGAPVCQIVQRQVLCTS